MLESNSRVCRVCRMPPTRKIQKRGQNCVKLRWFRRNLMVKLFMKRESEKRGGAATVRAGGRPKSGGVNGPESKGSRPRPWPQPLTAIWPSINDGRP